MNQFDICEQVQDYIKEVSGKLGSEVIVNKFIIAQVGGTNEKLQISKQYEGIYQVNYHVGKTYGIL